MNPRRRSRRTPWLLERFDVDCWLLLVTASDVDDSRLAAALHLLTKTGTTRAILDVRAVPRGARRARRLLASLRPRPLVCAIIARERYGVETLGLTEVAYVTSLREARRLVAPPPASPDGWE